MPIASPSCAQDPGAQRVERAGLDVAAALADEADDPLAQLRGGAVGERDREDPPRGDALDADEVGDPMGQDAGLARAGAGQDQERPFGGRDRARLLGVERLDDLGCAGGAPRRRWRPGPAAVDGRGRVGRRRPCLRRRVPRAIRARPGPRPRPRRRSSRPVCGASSRVGVAAPATGGGAHPAIVGPRLAGFTGAGAGRTRPPQLRVDLVGRRRR